MQEIPWWTFPYLSKWYFETHFINGGLRVDCICVRHTYTLLLFVSNNWILYSASWVWEPGWWSWNSPWSHCMNLVSEVMSAVSLRIQVFLDVMLCNWFPFAQYNIQEDLNHLTYWYVPLIHFISLQTVLRLLGFSTFSCFVFSCEQTASFWKNFILCGK